MPGPVSAFIAVKVFGPLQTKATLLAQQCCTTLNENFGQVKLGVQTRPAGLIQQYRMMLD